MTVKNFHMPSTDGKAADCGMGGLRIESRRGMIFNLIISAIIHCRHRPHVQLPTPL